MIILLGGCACVGKTTAAAALAESLDVPHLSIYDGFEGDISPFRGPDPWRLSSEELFRRLVAKSQALHANLMRLVAECGGSAVIEGEGVVPSLADELLPKSVSLIFIVESDGAAIGQNMAEKPTNFHELSLPQKEKVLAMCSAYNEWIRFEATTRKLPLVASRPWGSLANRILRKLS